jgi:hypothetical protein
MASSPQSFRQTIGIPPSTASIQDSTLIIVDAQSENASGYLKVDNVGESRKSYCRFTVSVPAGRRWYQHRSRCP